MSYESGVPMTNMAGIKALGVDMEQVVRLLVLAYCKQIFKHGFVHCDPHPVYTS
jgi:predicted unusual protein kinase regulating ubiquinone biosynthesis (AarF/ABC1/UbiB family)